MTKQETLPKGVGVVKCERLIKVENHEQLNYFCRYFLSDF